MTAAKKFSFFIKYVLSYRIPHFSSFVKKNCGGYCRRVSISLLFTEGLAVGALVHGGVLLVGAYHDAIQRAVVLGIAMVCTLLNGALNALVCMAIHSAFLLFLIYGLILCAISENIHCFF